MERWRIGTMEIGLLLLVPVILLGAKKRPELARGMASLHMFKYGPRSWR